MTSSTFSRSFPWGNVLFSLTLAGAFFYYAHGVHAAARGATDWVLVVPVAGIGIASLLVITGTKIVDWYREHAHDSGRTVPVKTLLFMALLVLYVGALPFIGFDIGSFVFLALTLYVQGEKRWWVLLGSGVLVSFVVVLVFVQLLNVRLPTILL
ncbi:tripartite tricarboxylate transporter TctB family protein [Halomonas sp. AOP12-C2-37]|uniref:Tripartite tricarboxylate transporter TctB family protein n=1 Tax=Halomonas casei TaxID=2742613 RepID=A0ABR9EZF2_9GAMM|nr:MULTISPECIES: tripartite tricarboxylate transporter TctB family protein [Halomonas]MBE0399599.1 tripartite tricarboxylate transporter TctB family protein [Halomonas casei]PCC23391.1 hypothetical protein CIK78_15780 [Halomonas sp. JB37]